MVWLGLLLLIVAPSIGGKVHAKEAFIPVVTNQGVCIAPDQVAVFSGLDIPAEIHTAANSFLAQQGKVDFSKLILDDAQDRYGRLQMDDLGLGVALVRAGLAYVRQPDAVLPTTRLSDLMEAEREAYQKKRGLWAFPVYADIEAERAHDHIGRYGFVVGRVVDVVRIKSMIYLNFGAEWRRDFTAVIKAGDVKKAWPDGFDPESYRGQSVRVRGWLERRNGAMISVQSPWQIETVGQGVNKNGG